MAGDGGGGAGGRSLVRGRLCCLAVTAAVLVAVLAVYGYFVLLWTDRCERGRALMTRAYSASAGSARQRTLTGVDIVNEYGDVTLRSCEDARCLGDDAIPVNVTARGATTGACVARNCGVPAF